MESNILSLFVGDFNNEECNMNFKCKCIRVTQELKNRILSYRCIDCNRIYANNSIEIQIRHIENYKWGLFLYDFVARFVVGKKRRLK